MAFPLEAGSVNPAILPAWHDTVQQGSKAGVEMTAAMQRSRAWIFALLARCSGPLSALA
jgi:hypothetical protein